MQLVNTTKMQAGYTMALAPDGRELLVVAVKGTFVIPDHADQPPALAEEQVELVHTDVFTGDPAFSAPLYEIDYAPRKPRCDVLLNGSAHAPAGKPVERLTVSLRVGTMVKSFDVVGNRVWKAGALAISSTSPEPFTVMPISYANAFGGVDKSQEDEQKFKWYPANFAGVGYHEYTAAKFLAGKPLPNTEETGKPVSNPRGSYRPMAFGPIGRAWQQRPKLAGTYDQKWLDERFPFLPADFDERYYQAAPPDQQIDYPKGGEEVELVNLTPEGRTKLRLPKVAVPIAFQHRDRSIKELKPVLDTLILEPNQRRMLLTWRATAPLRRSIHEIRLVQVGQRLLRRDGQPRRFTGKRRFATLAELVAWQRARNLTAKL